MLEIAVASEDRKEELWRLFLEYAEELSRLDGETRPHFRRHYDYFESYWEQRNRTPFIVLYDHEPVGFCFIHDTGVCFKIDEFYIRALHRRRGFGKMAVERVKHHCRRLRRHNTLAANVYVNNAPAIEFWRAAGFRDTGRRIRIKGLRMIEMEAEL